MKEVSVSLKTGGHCIQSAAKIEFRRITMIILEFTDDTVPQILTDQLELLTEFLENTDFNGLRASDERYAGIIDAVCTLSRDEDGKPVIKINQQFK